MKKENIVNYFLISMLIVAVLGSAYLWAAYDETAGRTYTIIFMVIGLLVVISLMAFKKDGKVNAALSWVQNAFKINPQLAIGLYLLGLFLPIVIQVIIGIAGGSYSITKLSIPLTATGQSHGIIPFATAVVENSMPWKIFIVGFTAGTLESFAFNIGLVVLGIIMVIMVATALRKPVTPLMLQIAGIGVATVTFIVAHTLNKSYQGWDFVLAGMFLIVSDSSILIFGMLLTFWIGYHQGNNLVSLALPVPAGYSATAVLAGFLSVGGILWILFVIILMYFWISGFSKKS